ncbi:DUF1638 domain-containing protein [Novipirellula artificiosorum]|uniref:DUF1638 domain-containing protein n=1 Tax=Novipirellula artificiosorum TaxID=2528016 RepID=A0A5C6DVK9_9BACT|nr:DUF1638 domain-containing protein [Novipirellula artificiosorum]TWU40740.1 hypothetical protein Poly41_15750 [Novipirellula artificiosorum]
MNAANNRRILLSCKIFEREVEQALARVTGEVVVEYLPLGLHCGSAEDARMGIQAALDAIDEEDFDTVLVGYGLCNFGIRGLVARRLPMVIPRSHDCISFLFGSRQRYMAFFEAQPDSYFLTAGWVDGMDEGTLGPDKTVLGSQLGLNRDLTALIEKYGEDNGRYLYDQLKPRQYAQRVYVTTGCPEEPALIQHAREEAAKQGCPLQVVQGDTVLVDRFLNGPWDEENFLVTPPGKQVAVVYDDRLIDWTEAE